MRLSRAINLKVLPAGIQVDLFFANQENWGYIQTLRTGPAEFNQFYLLPRLKNKGYILQEGNIWYDNTVVSIPDEETLFQLLNMKIIPPERRFKIGNQAKYHGFKSAR
jgi:DNA polymerase/3'-5' exonuclease PolX